MVEEEVEEEQGQNAGACSASERRRADARPLSKPACVITADLTGLRGWTVSPPDPPGLLFRKHCHL